MSEIPLDATSGREAEPPHVPGFLAVGPQRTASSWLDRALRSHPELALPAHVKETHFFVTHYDRGLDWYRRQFGGVAVGTVVGEVDSTCFDSGIVRERVAAVNPDCLVLIMVRNPVERAVSLFRQKHAKGRCSADFDRAVQECPHIIDAGRYATHASAWERTAGPRNVMYIVYDDILVDPQAVMSRVWRFLGVSDHRLTEELKGRYGEAITPRFPRLAAFAARTARALREFGHHRLVSLAKRFGGRIVYRGDRVSAAPPTTATLAEITGEYEQDIAFLERRLGRDFTHWRTARIQ